MYYACYLCDVLAVFVVPFVCFVFVLCVFFVILVFVLCVLFVFVVFVLFVPCVIFVCFRMLCVVLCDLCFGGSV